MAIESNGAVGYLKKKKCILLLKETSSVDLYAWIFVDGYNFFFKGSQEIQYFLIKTLFLTLELGSPGCESLSTIYWFKETCTVYLSWVSFLILNMGITVSLKF